MTKLYWVAGFFSLLWLGFAFDVAVSANTKSQSPKSETSPTHSSYSDAEANSERTSNRGSNVLEAESAFTQSEDESKSPQASPKRYETPESPSREYADNDFRGSFDAEAGTHRSFDDPSWGTFDNNDDDIDSVWGFNVKDSDHAKDDEKYFFNSNDSVSSPSRMDSPRTDDYSKSNSFFEDSVAGSPRSRAGNSPRYSGGSGDPFYGFSNFDSFRTNDQASSPRRETLSRFDSINSSRGFDFDDSDPFGSSGPFKVSSESQNSKKDSNSWNAS